MLPVLVRKLQFTPLIRAFYSLWPFSFSIKEVWHKCFATLGNTFKCVYLARTRKTRSMVFSKWRFQHFSINFRNTGTFYICHYYFIIFYHVWKPEKAGGMCKSRLVGPHCHVTPMLTYWLHMPIVKHKRIWLFPIQH